MTGSLNKKIKVLHVLSDSNIGGAGRYVSNLIGGCDSDRFELSVLLPRGSAAAKLIDGGRAKIIQADIAPDKSFDLRGIGVIRDYIKKERCDIVHAHGSVSARLAAKGLCKSVFTKHTLSAPGRGLRGAAERLVYRIVGGYAIAVSEAAAENLVDLGFRSKNVFTVYNGVSDMEIPSPAERAEAKKSFGIDASKTVIGCVGRFAPEKDYKTLLKALKTLYNRGGFAFLLCGEGDMLNEMKLYAKQLGIYSSCVFAGNVFDIERAYHAMDIYCITSRYESFGQSLVEAWSAGLPAVVTAARGFSEIAKDGVNALICPVGDYKSVSASLQRLARDGAFAARIAECGRDAYLKNYSIAPFCRSVEASYQKIAKPRSKPYRK